MELEGIQDLKELNLIAADKDPVVDADSTDSTGTGEEVDEVSVFDSIPNELLLKIFSYIDAKDLRHNMSFVCTRFQNILDEEYWKFRFFNYYNEKKSLIEYPPVRQVNMGEQVPSFDNFWSTSCMKFEEQIKYWTEFEKTDVEDCVALDNWNLYQFNGSNHGSCINSVHFIKDGKFLACGDRTGNLLIADVEQIKNSSIYTQREDIKIRNFSGIFQEDVITRNLKCQTLNQNENVATQREKHNGWLWTINSTNTKMFTGGWDGKIMVWSLDNDIRKISEFNVLNFQAGPCICISNVANDDNLMFCGTFHSQILGFDTRDTQNVIFRSRGAHKKTVLAIKCLEGNPNLIASASEDGFIGLSDIRKTFSVSTQSSEFVKSFQLSNYPTCMSFDKDSHFFYAGDIKGGIHLIDLDQFELVKSYDNKFDTERPAREKISGLVHNKGSIIACSSNGCLNVFEPSLNMKYLAKFFILKNKLELTSIHSVGNQLAVGGSDGTVRIFI